MDAMLGNVFLALNMVVVARQPDHTYYLATPAPRWLSKAFEHAAPGERRMLAGAFPFLDDFLRQADGAWKAGPDASLISGPFSATVDGDELLLRASAFTIGGHQLLVLERLLGAADTRPMLQKARQHMLDSERLTKQVGRIQAPVAAAVDALAQLNATPLSPEQQAIVDRLTAASERLSAAAAAMSAITAHQGGTV